MMGLFRHGMPPPSGRIPSFLPSETPVGKVVETITSRDSSIRIRETDAVPRQFFGLIGGDSHVADVKLPDGGSARVYGNSTGEVRAEAQALVNGARRK